MKNIYDIALKAGIDKRYVIPYGLDKCKIDLSINDVINNNKDGKLVLVTAITPTKAGEGKTTTSIALHDGFHKIGINSLLCLREPSLGPVFGLKGGATGGGLASIVPSDDINLHFTGDMHALTSAINLVAAIIDNHIWQGNELNIDPNNIIWKRALDMNDRALRNVIISNNDKKVEPRNEEFVITVASEMMAVLCLSKDENDFISRIKNIIVAYDKNSQPIFLKQLNISNAIYKLMKHALKPNLVQTLEENPVFVHGGPFANIAHGCNSIIATKMALKLAPIVITEAGFGADLGAEKFIDIKCRTGNIKPDAVVVVATIRALKLHGGIDFADLSIPNLDALKIGVSNLLQHLENMKKFNLPVIVCINNFASDSEDEVSFLRSFCKDHNYPVAFCDAYKRGGDGAVELARTVDEVLKTTNVDNFKYLYDVNLPIKNKIETICKEIYRAKSVIYTTKAESEIEKFAQLGYDKTPICIAKTPLSFSDNPKLLGVPKDFDITIREVRLSAGANFLVCLTGDIMTMPGLPKIPAAVKMEN